MDDNKNILISVGEWWERRQKMRTNHPRQWKKWLPAPGNVIFTLFAIALLIVTQSVWARSTQSATATSTSTISYQGRLADSGGTPLTGHHNLEFRIYEVPSGGTPLWEELWTGGNAVQVSDGLFNVMLGSLNTNLATTIEGHNELYLGITVDTDGEMMPRIQLGSVPFSMQALTVPDDSVTTNKIANGAITATKIQDGQVSTAKLNINDVLDMGGQEIDNVSYLKEQGNSIRIASGSLPTIRLVSQHSALVFIDSDNDEEDRNFAIWKDHGAGVPPATELFSVDETGYTDIRGTLNMHGNAIINQGAMVEANLQTTEELAAEKIVRFRQGDVLCYTGKQLEQCKEANDRRVVAVADENGKPIVIGAEPVKVLGPVQVGDLLVASNVPGFAQVNNSPNPGTIIAKALEEFGGDQDMIKAMIRTP